MLIFNASLKIKKVDLSGYATNLQRIFIVDEAHRGYNPAGSFLANLFEADKDSIKLALTGTPLLKKSVLHGKFSAITFILITTTSQFKMDIR